MGWMLPLFAFSMIHVSLAGKQLAKLAMEGSLNAAILSCHFSSDFARQYRWILSKMPAVYNAFINQVLHK